MFGYFQIQGLIFISIEKSAAESLVWKREREGGRFSVGGRWANTRLLSAWGICGIRLSCGFALIFCSCAHSPNILPSNFAKIPTWDEHTLTKNCSSRQIHIIVTLRSNLLELAMRGCRLCGCLRISALFCICAYFQIRMISMGFHADKGTRIYFPNPHSWFGSLYRLHNRKYAVFRQSKCLHKPHTLCGKPRLSMCVNRNA